MEHTHQGLGIIETLETLNPFKKRKAANPKPSATLTSPVLLPASKEQKDMAKDVSTIIKKVTGKGAGTYFYIRESGKDDKNKTHRVNAVVLGSLKSRLEFLKGKGRTPVNMSDWLVGESIAFDTFLNHCDEEKISYADAYAFMVKETENKVIAGPVKKTEAQKLASILLSLAPGLSGKELAAKLEAMLEDEKGNAIALVEEKIKANGRDENGWIYASTQAQRDKKKA